MNTLDSLAFGCLMAIIPLVVIGTTMALFITAFDRPETKGSFAIAGAILLGSGIIAMAIGMNKPNGGPAHHKTTAD